MGSNENITKPRLGLPALVSSVSTKNICYTSWFSLNRVQEELGLLGKMVIKRKMKLVDFMAWNKHLHILFFILQLSI